MHLSVIGSLRREAAIRASNNVFPPDEPCEPAKTLGDQLGMLDDIAGVRDDARDEESCRQVISSFPQVVLVLVTGIGCLE